MGDLSPETSHKELALAFSALGTVTRARMVEFQCYGFVTFSSKEEVENVLRLQGMRELAVTIKGHKVTDSSWRNLFIRR